MPALLSRQSRRPHWFCAASSISSCKERSPTSAGKQITSTPSAIHSCCVICSFSTLSASGRSLISRLNPPRASSSAQPFPIPRAAPVITATGRVDFIQ
ncbi:hypothetical protein ECDEC2A_5112 [Escherichia coli DEC2A]|nr:hypothetical protein ECDEC2A_5112 [Escherichia coli DEC2A]